MAAWLLALAVHAHPPADFTRYAVILARRPFGDSPAPEMPDRVPPPAQTGPSFADSIRVVALTYSQGDVRVGFVDSAAKPPKTYFLFVGESQDGIEVVDAGYDDETVVLRKDGVERTLEMRTAGSRVVERVQTATAADRRAIRRGSPVGGAPDAGNGTPQGRIRPRVLSPGQRARIEEAQRRRDAMPELHGKVLEKHLQEYNMQAIRSGAPPLPIPLTPEQDAQLVEEGVLPPME